MALYFQYSDFPEVIGALFRFVSVVAIAVVIAYMSSTLEKRQLAFRSISEFNEGIISNANVWLAVLDGGEQFLSGITQQKRSAFLPLTRYEKKYPPETALS